MLVSSGVSSWPGSTYCLQLWYYMSGATDAAVQLTVKLRRADGFVTPTLWGRNGHRVNNWYQAVIPFSEGNPFQVLVLL